MVDEPIILHADNKYIVYLYDTYSPILYTIALQILPAKKDAEDILICMFKNLATQKNVKQNKSLHCLHLIRLLMETSKQVPFASKLNINFKIKQFQQTPILNQLLFEDVSLENYCLQNCTTPLNTAKQIRAELLLIRSYKSNVVEKSTCNTGLNQIQK